MSRQGLDGTGQQLLSVSCAAQVPSGPGYTSVSWPIGIMSIDAKKISVQFRPPFGKKQWNFEIEGIRQAVFDRRSVLFRRGIDDFRIAMLSSRSAAEVNRVLTELGVERTTVVSTRSLIPEMYGSRRTS